MQKGGNERSGLHQHWIKLVRHLELYKSSPLPSAPSRQDQVTTLGCMPSARISCIAARALQGFRLQSLSHWGSETCICGSKQHDEGVRLYAVRPQLLHCCSRTAGCEIKDCK